MNAIAQGVNVGVACDIVLVGGTEVLVDVGCTTVLVAVRVGCWVLVGTSVAVAVDVLTAVGVVVAVAEPAGTSLIWAIKPSPPPRLFG